MLEFWAPKLFVKRDPGNRFKNVNELLKPGAVQFYNQ